MEVAFVSSSCSPLCSQFHSIALGMLVVLMSGIYHPPAFVLPYASCALYPQKFCTAQAQCTLPSNYGQSRSECEVAVSKSTSQRICPKQCTPKWLSSQSSSKFIINHPKKKGIF